MQTHKKEKEKREAVKKARDNLNLQEKKAAIKMAKKQAKQMKAQREAEKEFFSLADTRRVLLKWYKCKVSQPTLRLIAIDSEISHLFEKFYWHTNDHTSDHINTPTASRTGLFIWRVEKANLQRIAEFIKQRKDASMRKIISNLKQYQTKS